MGYPLCCNVLLNRAMRNLTQIREDAVKDQKENVTKSAVYTEAFLYLMQSQ